MKLFYDHLIVIEEIIIALDRHALTTQEKETFLSLIDQTLHHHVLDIILTHLPKKFHKEFLSKLSTHPHDTELMIYLKEKSSPNIEKTIVDTIHALKKDILNDIEKA